MDLPQMDLMVIVLIMVVLARFAGELLIRKKQSPIVGEVLVGVLMGPYIFGLVNPQRDEAMMAELRGIAELGVFFLIFHAGLELSLEEVGKSVRKALPVIFGGLAIPLLLGILVVGVLGFPLMNALFIALCLSLTALPVSIRVLSDLGRLRSIEGQTILATAIGNDIIAMVMLAIILNAGTSDGLRYDAVSWSVIKVAVFIGIVYLFHKMLGVSIKVQGKKVPALKHYLDRMVSALKSKESLFGIVMLFVLAFGGLAYLLDLHFLIGAFFGALLVSWELLGKANFERVGGIISAISMGFIAPLFFVYVGISFYIANFSSLYLVPIFLVVFTLSKYVGGHLGARAMSLHPVRARTVGIGIMNRGTMELIIANIGVGAGLLTGEQFSVIVLIVMVMMVITPLVLKRAFENVDRLKKPSEEVEYEPIESTTEGQVIVVQEYEPLSTPIGEHWSLLEDDVAYLSYENLNEEPPRLSPPRKGKRG